MSLRSRRSRQSTISYWLLLIGSLVVLFLSTYLAYTNNLAFGEEWLIRTVYGLPVTLKPVMFLITTLGHPIFIAGLILALVATTQRPLAIRVAVALSASVFITTIAKSIVDRPRPGEVIDVIARELFVAGAGFPSGHTAIVTAVGLVLLSYVSRTWKIVILIAIALVGISRLYLGVHAPLDIIGGFAIGVLVAVSIWIVLPIQPSARRKRLAK